MAQLNQLVERLIVARVEFVLVGGFAAIAHGVSLIKQDIDICCPFTRENLHAIKAAVAGLHPVHRMTPQRLPFVLTDELCANLKNLYLDRDFGPLDCLSSVRGGKASKQGVRATGGAMRCAGYRWSVKAATNRTHDRMTILQLKAIKERLGT
jgi:hypothetical protein